MASGDVGSRTAYQTESPRLKRRSKGREAPFMGPTQTAFSPLSLPQAKALSFPMLKQAQLVAPHGPAPETPVGGKELIRRGRAELCRLLFPPFSLLMAEVREGQLHL